MCIGISKKLSITSWNLNGLHKRVNGDRICKLEDENLNKIMKSDIVAFSETHTTSDQVLVYDGYKCFVNCRKSESNRVGGGLAIFVKKELCTGVKLIDKSMPDIIWFRLDKNFFHFEKDLYVCFLYIPPSNSSYTLKTNCDDQLFQKIDQDINKFSSLGDIMLMGDLNAHINKDNLDFIVNEVDDHLDDFLPSNYYADSIHKYRNTEIPQYTNKYGRMITELCIAAQLRVLNGRTLGDSLGKVTFINHNGFSIDDYCICSSDFLPNIVNFTVGDYEPTISDHKPIEVNILAHYSKEHFSKLNNSLKRVKWDKITEENFRKNFNNFNFMEIEKDLERITEPSNLKSDLVFSGVNEVVNKLSTALYNSACPVNKRQLSNKKYNKKRKIKKPYYDNECEIKYRSLKSMSRKLCTEPWNKALRINVLVKKKELIKLIRKKHRQFKQELLNKIVDSSEKNPEEFWKTLKTLKNKVEKDPSSNIMPSEWFDYFKNLMNVTHDNNFDNQSSSPCTAFQDSNSELLNCNINADEVVRAMKSLKNKKSCGSDGILNEMLKSACTINTKLFVKSLMLY